MAKYITKQRKILLDYLKEHIDEELCAKNVARDLSEHNLSLSAIYRNLADLEKENLIVQCTKSGTREFYFRYSGNCECSTCFHLSCKICNKIEHMDIIQSTAIKKQIMDNTDYILDLPSTMFYGICKKCQPNQD